MTANINSMVLLGLSWVNKIRHPCQYASQQLNQTCSTTAWIPTLQNYCFSVLFSLQKQRKQPDPGTLWYNIHFV